MNTASAALLNGIPILSFARDRWTDIPRCRHHVLSRLAMRGRVLFVSPPTHLRDAVHAVRTGGLGTAGLSEVVPGLFAFVPPPWLPYSHRPALNQMLENLRARHIRRLLKRLHMDRPILYLWHPAFIDMADRFDARLVVYHCYDEYAAFRGANREAIEAQEARLLRRADLVFTVSPGLRERRLAANPNVFVVRNGVDADHFAAALAPETVVPPDIAGIPRPIVGCIARVIPEYFDAALLRQVFQKRPDWSLVVVGPEMPARVGGDDEVNELKRLPNVHLLGPRPFGSLPAYLKGMDVCAIPYRMTRNNELADPLKLYEYLAAGRPIVSVPRDFADDMKPFVRTARVAEEWIAAIEDALAHDAPDQRAARQAVARENTWDQRVALISRLVTAALDCRRACDMPSGDPLVMCGR